MYDTIRETPDAWQWPAVYAARGANNGWFTRPIGKASAPTSRNGEGGFSSLADLIAAVEPQGYRIIQRTH